MDGLLRRDFLELGLRLLFLSATFSLERLLFLSRDLDLFFLSLSFSLDLSLDLDLRLSLSLSRSRSRVWSLLRSLSLSLSLSEKKQIFVKRGHRYKHFLLIIEVKLLEQTKKIYKYTCMNIKVACRRLFQD